MTRTETRRELTDERVWIDIVESFVKDGIRFQRNGYIIDGVVSSDIDASHFTAQSGRSEGLPPGTAEVLCGHCQGVSFTLAYGSYEISATCATCGFTAVVYDG